MSEWESKLKAIIREAKNENVTSIAGVPSWMLVLLNRILEETKKEHLLELWKHLEVYFHGGVSFTPYREQYKLHTANSEVHRERGNNSSLLFYRRCGAAIFLQVWRG